VLGRLLVVVALQTSYHAMALILIHSHELLADSGYAAPITNFFVKVVASTAFQVATLLLLLRQLG